jgi:signal transduction histidine kinase
MNQVKGLTDLIGMENGKLTETQKEYLTKIQSAISRVTVMINKILDVGAIDLKLGNIQLEEKDINGILQKVIKNYAKVAAKKNIKINSSLKTDKSIVIVDNNYIFPVFENLISNAIKFSPHGKVISIKVKEINDAVQIFVTDEGPGIMKEELPKLFRKFQKLSAKPTGNETSTGLGLSIVKKYVEAMEGKVWYEPDHKPGAKFVVELKKRLSKGFAFSLFL